MKPVSMETNSKSTLVTFKATDHDSQQQKWQIKQQNIDCRPMMDLTVNGWLLLPSAGWLLLLLPILLDEHKDWCNGMERSVWMRLQCPFDRPPAVAANAVILVIIIIIVAAVFPLYYRYHYNSYYKICYHYYFWLCDFNKSWFRGNVSIFLIQI